MLQRLWRTIARFFLWLAGDHFRPTAYDKSDDDNKAIVVARPLEIEPLHTHVEFHYPSLTIDDTARAFELEKQGRERGALEQPPSDSTALDHVELDIVAWAHQQARRISEEWQTIADLQEIHQLAARVRAHIEKAVEAERIAISDLRAEAKAPLDRSYLARDDAREKKREFESFRREHGLDRASRYPDAGIWNIAVLLGLIVVEALFNGTQLATGLSTGLIGGWGQAALFAALNAGVSFLLGWIARYVFHRQVALKLFGYIIAALALMWVIGLNLAVAHFRDALAIDPDNVWTLALPGLLSRPLVITNLASLLLLAMGFIFAVAAFIDGIHFEDPYPGYGPLDRKRRQVIEDSAKTIEAERRTVAMAKDEKLRTVNAARDFAYGLVAQHAEKARHAQQMRTRLTAYLHGLESLANHLVGIYRQANRSARNTDAPAHFGSPLPLDNGADTEPSIELNDDDLNRLNGCTDRLVAAYDELQVRFPTLEEL